MMVALEQADIALMTVLPAAEACRPLSVPTDWLARQVTNAGS